MMKWVFGFLIVVASSANGFAGSLTIRDLKLTGNNQLEIALDGAPPKASLEMEYVRDVVQFSIQNATIYPAKILHADSSTQSFSKVFAYQYAPNLVRVRFSVDGKADQFQGKVKWELKGKTLTVSFPAARAVAAKKEESNDHENSLLAKVLGQTHSDPKVEKVDDRAVKVERSVKEERAAKEDKAAKEERAENEERAAKLAKSEQSKALAKAELERENAIKTEAADLKSESKAELKTGHHLTGNAGSVAAPALGGAKAGPSGLRAFLSMLLVVGGLGLILIYVKKKKNTAQAKKVGDSWFSNLMPNAKKQKSLIEVVGVHALGPKQSITIVRIRGQQLVLGVTEGNVQLITQLDSDEDFDVMDDPKVADSLGKIFGAKPAVEAVRPAPSVKAAQASNTKPAPSADLGASFNALLKSSTGAGAIVARNAYQAQGSVPTQVAARSVSNTGLQSGVRDQIKQRLQGMRN